MDGILIALASADTRGYLYRGQDFEVLRDINLDDRQTWPKPNYDFYQGRPRIHTIPSSQGSTDVPSKETQLPEDPVARALELTKSIEPRICTAKEELTLIDDASCRSNDDCNVRSLYTICIPQLTTSTPHS